MKNLLNVLQKTMTDEENIVQSEKLGYYYERIRW